MKILVFPPAYPIGYRIWQDPILLCLILYSYWDIPSPHLLENNTNINVAAAQVPTLVVTLVTILTLLLGKLDREYPH